MAKFRDRNPQETKKIKPQTTPFFIKCFAILGVIVLGTFILFSTFAPFLVGAGLG